MNIGILSNLLKENSINNNRIVCNSLEKLSWGLKIKKAADHASGLAISDKLRTQATGIKQGIDNANSAITICTNLRASSPLTTFKRIRSSQIASNTIPIRPVITKL